jgi:hypothetical protein
MTKWQPKFTRDPSALAASLPDDGLDLTGLVSALERQPASGAPRSYCVAEFTQAMDPGRTAVADYVRRAPGGGPAELWVLGASASQTQRLSEAFGRADPAARFATADLSAPAAIDLGCGLLRACACDLVVVDARTTVLTAASWALLRRLLLPGGLVLVRHPGPGFAHPGPGWSKVGAGPHGALWAAPPGLFDDRAADLAGPRWVIGGEGSLGGLWADQAARNARRLGLRPGGIGWLWSAQAQQEMRALRAIDFFGDVGGPAGESRRDRLGVQSVTRFLAVLRALAAARKEQACAPCRLTIITCGATLDVRAPQETLLWGAARAMGRELDPTLRLDVRLVDVGGLADLPTLSWLARHDVRERALAVRKGRLHAPRLVHRPAAASGLGPGPVCSVGQFALGGPGVQCCGSPAVPGQHRPVRTVRIAERLELPRGRRRDLPGQPVAAADAEVADRPDVQAAELEQEEHLGRPGAYAADRGQAGDDLLIALPGQAARGQDHRPVQHFGCQVPQRHHLGPGQADRAERLVGQREQRLGLHVAAERGDQPTVDGGRRSPGQLLVDDGPDEGAEVRLQRTAEPRRTGLLEQPGYDGIPLGQDAGRGGEAHLPGRRDVRGRGHDPSVAHGHRGDGVASGGAGRLGWDYAG